MDERQRDNEAAEERAARRASNWQWRRPRGGFFFPLLLVAIGLVFLLDNLNMLEGNASMILLRSWPVLLIVAGLDSLLKREGVAGPTFLIGVGVLFLLSNFDLITWGAWGLFLRLWPVFIIAIGLDIIVGRRSVFGALIALVLMLAILGGALALIGPGMPATAYEIGWTPEETVNRLSAEIKPAVGAMRIDTKRVAPTSGTLLVQGMLYLNKGEEVDETYTVTGGEARISLTTHGPAVYLPTFDIEAREGWQVSLAAATPLDLSAGMGVGQAILDLSAAQLVALDVNLGIGLLEVTLPEGNYAARLDGGIGQIIVWLPEGADVRIVTDTGLTAVDLPPGFHEDEEDVFTSPGYDEAEQRIELTLDHGIGSVVVQYK